MKQVFFQERIKENLAKLLEFENEKIHSKEFNIVTASVNNVGNLTKIIKPKRTIEYAVGYLKEWIRKSDGEKFPFVRIINQPDFPEGDIYITSYDWKEVLASRSKTIIEKIGGSYRVQFLKDKKDSDFDPVIEAFIAYDTLPIEIVLPLVIIK